MGYTLSSEKWRPSGNKVAWGRRQSGIPDSRFKIPDSKH
jgi:hypothetical protein